MDTRDTRVHNLLFLLSAAPLGMGCIITSDDTETEGTPTTTSTPTSTTGETDPTAATEAMTTEVATEGMTGDTTAGPADTTEGPADTTAGETTGDVSFPPCEQYAAFVGECYMDPKAGASTLNYCLEQLTYYEAYGAECVGAFEDFLACLSALTCEELMGGDPQCEAEFMTIETVCVAK